MRNKTKKYDVKNDKDDKKHLKIIKKMKKEKICEKRRRKRWYKIIKGISKGSW